MISTYECEEKSNADIKMTGPILKGNPHRETTDWNAGAKLACDYLNKEQTLAEKFEHYCVTTIFHQGLCSVSNKHFAPLIEKAREEAYAQAKMELTHKVIDVVTKI